MTRQRRKPKTKEIVAELHRRAGFAPADHQQVRYAGPLDLNPAVALPRVRLRTIAESLSAWGATQEAQPSVDDLRREAVRRKSKDVQGVFANLLRTVPTAQADLEKDSNPVASVAFILFAKARAARPGPGAVRLDRDGIRGPVQTDDDLRAYIQQMDSQNGALKREFLAWLDHTYGDEREEFVDKMHGRNKNTGKPKKGLLGWLKKDAIRIIDGGTWSDLEFEINQEYEKALSSITLRQFTLTAATSFYWNESLILVGDLISVPEREALRLIRDQVARPPTPEELSSVR